MACDAWATLTSDRDLDCDETVRLFGHPEELSERLEASGYDIPPSEIEGETELHLPYLVKVGKEQQRIQDD